MTPWIYQNKPVEIPPDGMVGFIYNITCKLTGKQYIGKKFCFSRRRHKVAGRKNKKIIIKDSGWQEYWSSSDFLLEDIAKLGKENFTREILEFYPTKKEVSFAELEEQIKRDVLRAKLPDGSKAYYNRSILGKYFCPPENILDNPAKT